MEYTQEQLEKAGYQIKAAPAGAWRNFDEQHPIPGYFEFDWLSSRHPDLYHEFSLSTVGLMNELHKIVDLAGLGVLDCGAGTGRATSEAARFASTVTAIDIFEAVIPFGIEKILQAGLRNVAYIRADNAHLPFADNSFDAAICAWSIMDYPEAYRVLRPGGYLVELGPAPGSLCGELTATLAEVYPEILTEIAPADRYDPACPASDTFIEQATWNGLPVTPPTILHDFTSISDYVDPEEASAIVGRMYGPAARRYLLDRQQAALSWRLRIAVSRVRK